MNAFAQVRPKAQPGPAKAPIRYVRGGTFEVTTQAIFGRPRMPGIHIENAEHGRASADRRWAIQRGGL